MHKRFSALLLCALAAGVPASAQFKFAGKDIQVHGFIQQGFVKSTNNNFLTMKTRDGSFSMTDGGFNISSRLTPKLRVGAQAFSRNIGDLSNGQVVLDWAFADYKFNDWFGIRGGKVKTQLGLFTDTQDMEFVHTWALLPQSMYPIDQRATTISHVGGDIYGDFQLKKAGKLSYVVYVGSRPEDRRGGYFLGTRDAYAPISSYHSTVRGGDLRWYTPIDGLMAGYSHFDVNGGGDIKLVSSPVRPLPPAGLPGRFDLDKSSTDAFYADFQRGAFRTYAELWRMDQDIRLSFSPGALSLQRYQAWYVAASYRVHKNVEIGSYYNNFAVDRRLDFSPTNGIRGPVVSARFDVNRYWNIKAETHFIDGYGTPISSRTFYPSTNPDGFKPKTTVFLIRTGFAF